MQIKTIRPPQYSKHSQPDSPIGRMYAKGEELVAARKAAADGAQADGTGEVVAA